MGEGSKHRIQTKNSGRVIFLTNFPWNASPNNLTHYKLTPDQFSCSIMSDSLGPHGLQHATLPVHHQFTELAQPNVHWVGDVIQQFHSVFPFSSYLQSFKASGFFPVSQLFIWGGQSTGASASVSVLPMNIQDWFHLGWTGWISLQSKILNSLPHITVQKHQFFGAQLSL